MKALFLENHGPAETLGLGLLIGAALGALLFITPAEAGGRSGRAAAFSQSCCDGPHGLTLRYQKPPKHRAGWVLASGTGTHTGTRTGTGTSTGSSIRMIRDPKTGTIYLLVIPRAVDVSHSTRTLCGGCTAHDSYFDNPNRH